MGHQNYLGADPRHRVEAAGPTTDEELATEDTRGTEEDRRK
jgi:hypothetical protein